MGIAIKGMTLKGFWENMSAIEGKGYANAECRRIAISGSYYG